MSVNFQSCAIKSRHKREIRTNPGVFVWRISARAKRSAASLDCLCDSINLPLTFLSLMPYDMYPKSDQDMCREKFWGSVGLQKNSNLETDRESRALVFLRLGHNFLIISLLSGEKCTGIIAACSLGGRRFFIRITSFTLRVLLTRRCLFLNRNSILRLHDGRGLNGSFRSAFLVSISAQLGGDG
jgi:hypothetical protein